MKHLFKFKLVLLLAVTAFYSCSDDGHSDSSIKSNEQNSEVLIGEIPLNLKGLQIGTKTTLFTYTTVAQAIDSVDTSFSTLFQESLDEFNDYNDISDVYTKVTISNGEAYISEILHYDSNSDKMKRGWYLDESINKYVVYSAPVLQSININAAKCPGGYTELANCGNFSNPQECVASAIKDYMTNNLTNPGDCTMIYTKVSLTNTRVCGKKC
ncbi:hypothetical protein GCM10007424_05260 [Flavobacterium suaedae]|uniref:Lipoprotein n=1 Tax=Flavobacterium suaedae TaxID=1767027 RepID=A0ABQ1JG90_9FLAO|nr:hypothetical protein [Flavobacterium suaedae]GGB68204.1 hypothetical protein GCM10007424_05260 [Flavobacterium suaedae]